MRCPLVLCPPSEECKKNLTIQLEAMALRSEQLYVTTSEIRAIQEGQKVYSMKPTGIEGHKAVARGYLTMTGAATPEVPYAIFQFGGKFMLEIPVIEFHLGAGGGFSVLVSTNAIPEEFRPEVPQYLAVAMSQSTPIDASDQLHGYAQLSTGGKLQIQTLGEFANNGDFVFIPGFVMVYPEPLNF